MEAGKEKGYVLYDEVAEVLPSDLNGTGELDDLLAGLDSAGIDILEEPKLDKLEEGEEALDLELPPGVGDKTNDPVRMYLREMGTVALLTREGEIEIAKRIERGQTTALRALSRSPLVIQKILELGEELRKGTVVTRDVLLFSDPLVSDEAVEERKAEVLRTMDEIVRLQKKALQLRQRMLAVPRTTKPKQARRLRWELGRMMVRISRLIRSIKFSTAAIAQFTGCIRKAVDELKPLERDIARLQRKMEGPEADRPEAAKDLRKEQRGYSQKLQLLEEQFGASATELRRTLQIITRGDREAEQAKNELI